MEGTTIEASFSLMKFFASTMGVAFGLAFITLIVSNHGRVATFIMNSCYVVIIASMVAMFLLAIWT